MVKFFGYVGPPEGEEAMTVRELAASLLALPDDVQDMPVTTIVVSDGLWYVQENPEIRVVRQSGDKTGAWPYGEKEGPHPRVEIE